MNLSKGEWLRFQANEDESQNWNARPVIVARYVQHIGSCFCLCSAKMGVAKKEKEYKDAKEYWEARK